jgi:hypothetical protein
LGHRVGQFIGHLTARVDPAEEARARHLLPEAAWPLFAAMLTADRRHALNVASHLLAAGHTDPDLLAAAMLHDVAKGRRMRLWHRIAGVLLAAIAPRLLAKLASPDERSWRHPFHLYLHHAALSAEAALRAGCSQRTVDLIRGTSEPPDAQLLAALRRADEAS